MDQHLPHQLQGDQRTTKTNAMKDNFLSPSPPGRGVRGEGLFLSPNPNKGATRTKMLGLWEAWHQTIRIERWRLHKRLAQHFLICPNSPSLLSPSPLGRGVRGEDLHSSPCQGKSLKLFIPLCTKAEALDADLAEACLNQLDIRSTITQTSIVPNLINRYGLLFRNERKLVCRKCLNLRYGQVRK